MNNDGILSQMIPSTTGVYQSFSIEEVTDILEALYFGKDLRTKKLNKPKDWRTIRKNNLKKIKI